MVSVAIFDYGAGNIFSLKNSLEQAGASVDVITSFDQPNVYSGLLLPGVGNFDPAIKSINENSKTKFHDFVKEDTPVLGICLGMEMFFEKSEEGVEKGFNVIDGEIVVLPSTMKVPHMGWNNLEIKKPGMILDGVDDGSWVYFVHSYRAKPTSDDVITAESDYGVKVPAVVEKNNFFGTQFHPEKSGDVGKIMIQNFLNVCKK
ncbi:imidazole glycerol phosphate synthase subunit HisH [Nitrosopumilus sp.]|nr:imidazole glycerol phosphate synthase subunit HisH [Nitrosopumilus sp.]